MPPMLSLDQALLFALDVTHAAGTRLRHWFGAVGHTEKADHSPVTAADVATERFLTAAIGERFPGHGIIAEEEHAGYQDHEWTWVLDPLDGTTNYANGLPYWAISLALVRQGDERPAVGVVHLPLPGETYHAVQGRGAFLNGHRIQVSPATRFDVNSFMAVYSHAQRDYVLEAVPGKPRIYGSAAYDFCLVARGTALLGLEPQAKVWDVAAGWLILQEAGGVPRLLDGTDVFPLQPGDYANRRLAVLSAANETLWQGARSRLVARSGRSDQ
ncbi:MAG: inositol monophosphatase [Chloroflexi bacterium]|nr:inositol monophosphatase [Chloroflexota bacterium]MBU1747509.1 inositol monophosphatase [Chloroflexota bacterium]MBU1878015.1 inositol monophosphatase [Chloroflexota bacterium]